MLIDFRRMLGVVFGGVLLAQTGCVGMWSSKQDAAPYSALDRVERTYEGRQVAYEESDSQAGTRESNSADDDGVSLSDLSPSKLKTTLATMAGRGPDREAARENLELGMQAYQQAVAKKNAGELDRSAFESAGLQFTQAADRWPDSALAEDALFHAGESFFFAEQFVKSNEQFERLLEAYQNSKYIDLAQARRFSIAQYWLDLTGSERESFLSVNFTDQQRPWRDTFGNALRIFNKIPLDDPTGKLADDAMLAAANTYFVTKNYIKADQYYTDLRRSYPSSEHQFKAHLLGMRSKLLSYQGPEYSGDALEAADKLLKQIRKQFPEESRQFDEELVRAYREIRYKQAERDWQLAKYFDRRREFGAARVYYDEILTEYPDTPFAEQTRERLGEIVGKPNVPPQRLSWLVNLFPSTDTQTPLLATKPGSTKSR